MKYYIPISAWNLLESFTTESISPVTFYSERAFGAKLTRNIQNKFDRAYQLVLSTKDNGGDYTIEVDESLIDKNLLVVEKNKNLFSYPKTIYYQKGLVTFRFNSQELMDSLIAQSQILFEVKCVGKYQSDFYVKELKPARINATKIGNALSFEYQNYISKDNWFNFVKGAITGYARGLMTDQSNDSRVLHTKVAEIKNVFAGLNTWILMGDGGISDADKYIRMIDECKNLYLRQRDEPTRIFDIMKQQFNEIVKLATMRAGVITGNGCFVERDSISSKIMDVRNKLSAIEKANNIGVFSAELEAIKNAEQENGAKVGKKRLYFKAGTPEYERKRSIKDFLRKFSESNPDYIMLKEELKKLYAKQMESGNETEMLEGAIQAIFIRLSDLSNEIIKKIDATESRNSIDLSAVKMDEHISIVSTTVSPAEMAYFNTMLSVILDNPIEGPISEVAILDFVQKATKAFMKLEVSATQSGLDIVNCMRGFWLYKNHRAMSFEIPAGMEVITSIMGFLVKPFGFDQIERYLMNKKCMHKEYAFMLWGACIGYADMPKTFTEVLYADSKEARKLDSFIRNFI